MVKIVIKESLILEAKMESVARMVTRDFIEELKGNEHGDYSFAQKGSKYGLDVGGIWINFINEKRYEGKILFDGGLTHPADVKVTKDSMYDASIQINLYGYSDVDTPLDWEKMQKMLIGILTHELVHTTQSEFRFEKIENLNKPLEDLIKKYKNRVEPNNMKLLFDRVSYYLAKHEIESYARGWYKLSKTTRRNFEDVVVEEMFIFFKNINKLITSFSFNDKIRFFELLFNQIFREIMIYAKNNLPRAKNSNNQYMLEDSRTDYIYPIENIENFYKKVHVFYKIRKKIGL